MILCLCTQLRPISGEMGREREHLHSLESSGAKFRRHLQKTALESTLPSFHTVPESSVTSPRSLSGPRVSHGNTQKRKNCSLPRKDALLEERKKKRTVGQRRLGRVEREKKKGKRREILGPAGLSSRKTKT